MSRSNYVSYSTAEEVASSFNTDLQNGLQQSECDSRLSLNGFNEFKTDESSRIVSKYLEQFKNPLIQLLLVSVIISFITGQHDDAISITLVSCRFNNDKSGPKLVLDIDFKFDIIWCSFRLTYLSSYDCSSFQLGYNHCSYGCFYTRVQI